MSTQLFLSAFQWIAQSPNYLNDFGHLWTWWLGSATASQKQIILEQAKHPLFAQELRNWAALKWPQHPAVGDLLICQLASEEPFSHLSTWTTMAQEISNKGSTQVFGVAVSDNIEGNREHVWKMRALLLPRLGNENIKLETLNFTLDDREAKAAPERTVRALRAVLSHLSGWPFFLWFLWSGWKQTISAKWSVVALPVTLLLLILLQVLPDQYFASDILALLWTTLFAASSFVLVRQLPIRMIVSWKATLRDSARWIDLLENSNVLISIHPDEQTGANRFIQGSSYSVTLAISLLLALDESTPAYSSFFRSVVGQLKKRRTWLYTAGLSETGIIEPVTYLTKKFAAALDHEEITVFVYSVKNPPIDHKQCALPSVQQVTFKREPANNYALGVVAHAGSPARTLQQLRFDKLSDLLFEVPRFKQYAPGVLLMICTFVLSILSGLAAYDGYQLSVHITPPRMSMVMQVPTFDTHAKASLTVCGNNAHQFGAKLTSDYWQSLPPLWFPPGPRLNYSTTIPINLTKSEQANEEYGIYDGKVELLRRRSLLWRELPPVEKASITTVIDLLRTTTVRCSEEE